MKTPKTSEKQFVEFLYLYNKLDVAELQDIDEILRREEKLGVNFDDDQQRFAALRRVLNEIIPDGVDKNAFIKFVYKSDAIEEIDNPRYMTAQSSGHLDLDMAYQLYKVFFLNATTFKSLLTRLEYRLRDSSLRGKTTLGREKVLCDFVFDADDRTLSCEPVRSLLFWGFDKFDRVKRCGNCDEFFVQIRTDQEYCSASCRNSSQQKKYYAANKVKILEGKKKQYDAEKERLLAEQKERRKEKELERRRNNRRQG